MSILLDAIIHTAIKPALLLLPARMDKPEALMMMLAIGLQESRFEHRAQKTRDPYQKGPARGLWQFERGGGVYGVMSHRSTTAWARELCESRKVPFDAVLVHAKLEYDDILAAGFARLLLWADSKPLPKLDASPDETWACYIRSWRPGKPHRHTWDEFHMLALSQVIH